MSPKTMIERVAVLETQYFNLQKDLDEKHTQNRKSIHDLKDSQGTIIMQQHLIDKSVSNIKTKLAAWSTVAGIVTAVFLKVLDHIWK